MEKTEIILLAATIIILMVLLYFMPEYSLIFGILLVLAVVILLMTGLMKYKDKYKNEKLSVIFCAIGIIIFIILFANSIYSDFTSNKSLINGFPLVILFIVSICLGWFFEEK